MKIYVQLDTNCSYENEIIYDFMDLLLKNLKGLLYSNIKRLNKNLIENALLNNDTILWKTKRKPKNINVDDLLTEIIENIDWYEFRKNFFIIKIKTGKMMSNTNTQLSTIANFIEYGSNNMLPLHFFSKYFNKFANEVTSYWSTYKDAKSNIIVRKIYTEL